MEIRTPAQVKVKRGDGTVKPWVKHWRKELILTINSQQKFMSNQQVEKDQQYRMDTQSEY